MPFYLKILAAPRDEMVGIKVPLHEGANLLGRSKPPSVIVLEGKKVSKSHCTFHLKGASLSVEDNGSSNGVYLNGKKITNAGVKEKDRLVIGEYTLEVTVN